MDNISANKTRAVCLLFDANLSPALPGRLAAAFPGCVHVADLEPGVTASDSAIWDLARDQGMIIVSKDSDFQQRALVVGPPPKVIWVRLGNCRTALIETLIRQRAAEIAAFAADSVGAVLVIP
ncbi:MAG: DUF5615 family PIN-like protein [Nitrospirae bacterium]|nr:DUF5615 family PIN-like protein [Fimbriimonadaceae bacterium]